MTEFFGGLGRFMVRFVLTALGLVFLASLLVAGLLAASGLTVWALLRGRRPPPIRFHRFSRPGWTTPGPGARSNAKRSDDRGVVDVEAREIR